MMKPQNILRLFLLVIATLHSCIQACAQDSLITAQIAILSKKIDSIGAQNDEQPIGILRLNPNPVDHFYKTLVDTNKNPTKSTIGIKIDRITLYFKDGYILDVHAYSGTKEFTNRRAPIDLRPKRLDDGTDYLVNPLDHQESIKFQQILIHDSLTSYIPNDGFYTLTPSVNKLILYRQTGINTVIDLRIYTDALGLFSKDPNGVIQTDAHIKQILNIANVHGHGAFFFHYAKINFTASKFTTNNSIVDSAHFSRTSLLQQSFLNADVTFNLLSSWLGIKSTNAYYFDGGLGVSEARVKRGSDTSTVSTINWFLESRVEVQNADNMGFTLYLRFMDQFSPQTDWGNNSQGHLFGRLGGELFYNPINNKANRLFARVNYTFSTSKDDPKNGFLQAQLGYSVLLSSLVKK